MAKVRARSLVATGAVLLTVAAVAMFVPAAKALPIVPAIEGVDIQFGTKKLDYIYNATYNGQPADRLEGSVALGGEVTAVYYPWAVPGQEAEATPLWYGTKFGADVYLNFLITGIDDPALTPPGSFGLVGTGGSDGYDFVITGTTTPGGANEILWALEITDVAIYGYAGDDACVIEAMGIVKVCHPSLGVVENVINTVGVVRGHADIIGPGFSEVYTPADEMEGTQSFYYSAETGATWSVPEPATLTLLALGVPLAGLLRRRRRA